MRPGYLSDIAVHFLLLKNSALQFVPKNGLSK